MYICKITDAEESFELDGNTIQEAVVDAVLRFPKRRFCVKGTVNKKAMFFQPGGFMSLAEYTHPNGETVTAFFRDFLILSDVVQD